MKKSTKIWLIISGILLVILGILCICKPAAALFTTAWLIGCFTLAAGMAKLVFTFETEAFLPNSGSRMLSGVLLVILGLIFLFNNFFVTLSLPIIFAMWVLIDGVIIAIESFDFKKVGFPSWWVLLLLGIAGAVLGVLGLKNPDVSAATLSTLIGIGVITLGLAYIFAVCGVSRFEKKVTAAEKKVVTAATKATTATTDSQ